MPCTLRVPAVSTRRNFFYLCELPNDLEWQYCSLICRFLYPDVEIISLVKEPREF